MKDPFTLFCIGIAMSVVGIGISSYANGMKAVQAEALRHNVAQYNLKTADFEFKRCPTDNTPILSN